VKDIECFKRKEEEEEEVLLFTDNRYSSVNRKMNKKSWSVRDLHWSIQYLGKEFYFPNPATHKILYLDVSTLFWFDAVW